MTEYLELSRESLYFLALYGIATASVLAAHVFRARITLGPLFAVVGMQIFLLWQMRQLGWWLDIAGMTIDTALLGFLPPLMLGLLSCYALDGLRVARAYISVILITAVIAWLFAEFRDLLAHQVPIPYVFYLSSFTHFIAILSLLCASIALLLCYALLRRMNVVLAFFGALYAGVIGFSLSKNLLEYGILLGWAGFTSELLGYLLFALPCAVIAARYGYFAQQHSTLMPGQQLADILSFWRSSESNADDSREDMVNARKIISELRHLNNELAEAQRINRYQMRKSPLAILHIDLQARIQYANPAAEKLLGGRLIGRDLFHYISDDKLRPENLPKQAQISSALTIDMQAPGRSECCCDLSVTPRYDARKQISGYGFLLKDVTRERQLQRRQKLESKLRDIQDVGKVIAHDFSNLLLGMQGLLLQLESENRARHSITDSITALKQAIGRGREMLRQLVTGHAIHQPRIENVDVEAILREAVNIHRVRAREKGIVLQIQTPQAIQLKADPGQLSRVIGNLLGNAIRATPQHGAITLSAAERDREVLIRVVDSGAGLDREQLQLAFDPGYSTKEGGRGGLGLAISRQIIEAHGGTLTLRRNDPEPGVSAIVILPKSSLPPTMRDRKLLLGLQHSPGRDALIGRLEDSGCLVTETRSIQEFQALLQEDDDWQILVSQYPVPADDAGTPFRAVLGIDPETLAVKYLAGSRELCREIETTLQNPS